MNGDFDELLSSDDFYISQILLQSIFMITTSTPYNRKLNIIAAFNIKYNTLKYNTHFQQWILNDDFILFVFRSVFIQKESCHNYFINCTLNYIMQILLSKSIHKVIKTVITINSALKRYVIRVSFCDGAISLYCISHFAPLVIIRPLYKQIIFK